MPAMPEKAGKTKNQPYQSIRVVVQVGWIHRINVGRFFVEMAK
jgi:hypothetical protein